jgi:hypothetical protein
MSNPYIKGFNEGYVMTEHLPDLARDLSKTESAAPRMEGFRDGRRQYVLEQTKDLRPTWLTVGWNRDHQPDQAKDHDRDIER